MWGVGSRWGLFWFVLKTNRGGVSFERFWKTRFYETLCLPDEANTYIASVVKKSSFAVVVAVE